MNNSQSLEKLCSQQIQRLIENYSEPEKAREFLRNAGIIDENGNLMPPYQPITINYPMTQEHPITPPLELLKYWEEQHFDEGENYDVMLIKAYQAGADQQLEQDAKWLDTKALFSSHLTITPSGDALRQVMRPKPPSLKDEVKEIIECLVEGDCVNDGDAATLRRILEFLPD